MKSLTRLLVGLSVIIWSCDEIDDPIPKDLGNQISSGSVEFIADASLNLTDSASVARYIDSLSWDSAVAVDNSNTRFIPVEEFTGHRCQNCPVKTKIILDLDSIMGHQLIPITIHAGTFANFVSTASKYFTNFRVPGGHGETYTMTFNPDDAYPRALVSRLGGRAIVIDQVAQEVNTIKNDVPLASIKMTNYFNASTNVIRSNIEIEWKQTLPEQFNLQVFVLEDHIIDWQKDDRKTPIDVEMYDHRHVLRKVVNGTFGKALKSAVSGEKETIEYIFPFTESLEPNNEDNYEVVAFIYNADPSSYEVIQANAAHVK